MPEDNLIDWDQVRLNARRMLKDWAERKQMPTSPRDQEDMPGAPGGISKADMWDRAKAAVAVPLYRRRESVTAAEVMTSIKEVIEMSDTSPQLKTELERVNLSIEVALDRICGKNRSENAERR